MKNYRKISFFLFLISFSLLSAQKDTDWKKMDKTEKKAALLNMTSEEKMNLLQSFRQNMMEEDLGIPESKKQEFRALYLDYQNSQKEIKKVFQPRKDFENLTDLQAFKELNSSFDIAQKLLDNKKAYSKKFQKILKPQQVLQMFANEGKIRSKVRDKKQEKDDRNHN